MKHEVSVYESVTVCESRCVMRIIELNPGVMTTVQIYIYLFTLVVGVLSSTVCLSVRGYIKL